MPFFSVVIPLYNKEDYINTTLNSVLNQSFNDFEIIVVNDGSTDDSEKIINNINDSRIKLFTIENQGASYARNFGIKKSTGSFIAFLDADDIWLNLHLNTLYHLINEYPEAKMFSTGYQLLHNKKHYKKALFNKIPNDYRGIIDDYFTCNIYDPIINSSVVVVSCEVLEDIGGFDVKMKSGQDTDLWTKIAIKHKVAIHNIVTATIVKNDNSLSNSNLVKDRLLFLNKFIEHEISNPSLKKFMDLNRYAVALNYKITGEVSVSKSVYKEINQENLSFKQKFVFNLPSKLLKIIYYLKRNLDKKGVFFHLYR